MPTDLPLIGITVDNRDNTATSGRYESSMAYSRAIAQAGGLPLLLPHEPALTHHYVALCDGFLLTGGADPRMERFGRPMHAQASPVDARRQEFELALLAALDRAAAAKPALGVCLGMQFMALHAGGKLNQHLADTLPEADTRHRHNARHDVRITVADSVVIIEAQSDTAPQIGNRQSAIGNARSGVSGVSGDDLTVVSSHHQAVEDPGRLRTVALSADGVIEAVDDPGRPFYLGVQWHPERGGEGRLNQDLLRRFVRACRGTKA
jgi:putative glutamine amidotransferase